MTVSNNPKLKAKLGKANDLEFLLSIKGTSSDPMAIQPEVRFHLKEQKSNFGLLFAMERIDGEKVKVSLPADLPYFTEGKTYTGIVEVNLGNRLFTPTTVDIVFEKELEVVALPILEKQEEKVVEEEKIPIEQVLPESSLSKGLNFLDIAFTDIKKVEAVKAPPALPKIPPKTTVAAKKHAGPDANSKDRVLREKIKSKFKAMLAD